MVCHAWPSRALCAACVHQFAQPVARCNTCALPVLAGMQQCGKCIVNAPPLDQTLASVAYAFPWSGLIQGFKFHEDTAMARTMATLMQSTPWVEPALEAADWVLAVPLSRERLQERGFNQSLLLAQALDRDKTRTGVLLRIRHTEAQSSLSRAERKQNLQGAFMLEPAQYAHIRGKRIVIVDDVMTTGTTLYAAARILREAGAAHITALVFSRTE